MTLKDHTRSLARKLLDAKSRGERLRVLEEEERQLLRELKREAIEEALELTIERVLGPRWQRREEELSPWLCHHCGSRWLSQMWRNGHYRRNLVVGEGVITLWVPQVECKRCGKSIRIEWGILEPRSRYWIEIDKDVTELYMNGASHRKVVEMLARRIESSLSPMTSWRVLQKVGEGVEEAPPEDSLHDPVGKIKVVALDDITHRVRGERRYTLAGQDGERGEWLAMKVSERRDEEAWVALLDELWDRGISPDRGVKWAVCDGELAIEGAVEIAYPGVRVQRCIWHLLKNAQMLLEKRYPQREGAERRKLMGMVRGVLTAPSEEEAYTRFKALAQEDAPLARYLWPQIRKGIEYLRSPREGIPLTTSRMERAIREYRRRTRPMDGFKSDRGAENFNRLWMVKENARKRGLDWIWEVIK